MALTRDWGVFDLGEKESVKLLNEINLHFGIFTVSICLGLVDHTKKLLQSFFQMANLHKGRLIFIKFVMAGWNISAIWV